MFTPAIKKLKAYWMFFKDKKMGTVSRFLNLSAGHFISKQIYILKIILKVYKCVKLPKFGLYFPLSFLDGIALGQGLVILSRSGFLLF